MGASGNVGTSLLRARATEPAVDSVLGISRRLPAARFPKTDWAAGDVVHSDLVTLFRGADAFVHLARLIQPSRDLEKVSAVNVEGSARVFHTDTTAAMPALVYASSSVLTRLARRTAVSTRAGRPPVSKPPSTRVRRPRWSRCSTASSGSDRTCGVVRMRPALIFKREAPSEIRRLFAGPFLPSPLLRRGLIPMVPTTTRLAFQAVHSFDVGDAYRRAILSDASGAFNLAAEPRAGWPAARPAAPAARATVTAEGRRRPCLPPTTATERGRLDRYGPRRGLMDTTRAREQLGLKAEHTAVEALLGLFNGPAGIDTPPLSARTSGPLRIPELLTGRGEGRLYATPGPRAAFPSSATVLEIGGSKAMELRLGDLGEPYHTRTAGKLNRVAGGLTVAGGLMLGAFGGRGPPAVAAARCCSPAHYAIAGPSSRRGCDPKYTAARAAAPPERPFGRLSPAAPAGRLSPVARRRRG